ncbi:MAG: tetrathionate reductase family octaheme c-type cytochrome [Rhodocyclaceae bacterium]|jgi:octaheme c-type cytochrome (tetrathionate reductase family)|nr:tetrathionate reductase family octaheme c-type cytochrome [Rhodocyclaceae bacterium]
MQPTHRIAKALFIGWLALAAGSFVQAADQPKAGSTADHSKFKELQQDFQSGPEVTKACLSCHTEAAKQIMHTEHWNWEYLNPKTDQKLGKIHVINNFCTSSQSNLKACASCHIGYNAMTDKGVKNDETLVDCLACHDTTGAYSKPSGLGGMVYGKDVEVGGKIIKGLNLQKMAQKVGKTSRKTCGACHFNGGGGDGVKHGDLDSSLEDPDKKLDVHMDSEGLNFTCATCHKTDGHNVPGSRYAPTAVDKEGVMIRGKEKDRNPATCQSCHGQKPHKEKNAAKLNNHTNKLACQTCHIPAFARGEIATKMYWDWSTAGKRGEDGKPLVIKNEEGHPIYMGIKGDFKYGENVKPDYVWFNGDVNYTLRDTKVDKAQQPIYINKFEGSPTDGRSRIWPVKTFRGKQPYDAEYKTLVVTHLAGADDTAFWTNLDWDKAIEAGMKEAGLPFSGKIDFIETISQWPITHMVAPKEKAVACNECHTQGGRLEGVPGVYLPGRDRITWLDNGVKLLALLTLLAVLGHGLLRIFTSKKH